MKSFPKKEVVYHHYFNGIEKCRQEEEEAER